MGRTVEQEYMEGGWIRTFTGRRFYPLNPEASKVDPRDIAHALSNQCRFGGHTRRFYSVAEHSVRVSELCSPDGALWGLLHDGSEAYMIDMPRPIKHGPGMEQFREAERKIMAAICRKFGLPPIMPTEVAHADLVLLMTETRDLMPSNSRYPRNPQPLEREIRVPWSPAKAEAKFWRRFEELHG